MLSYSEIESERFGFRIYRGQAAELDAAAISREIVEQEVDIAMIRMPSSRQYQVASLVDTGFPFIVADALACYRVDLTQHRPQSLRNRDLSVVPCQGEHLPTLKQLVREAFQGYRNHYSSNPLLRQADVLDAFPDWASRYVGSEAQGRTCWMATRGGPPVGFGACSSDRATAIGVLFGVAPSAQGQGIFSDLIRFCQQHFREQGCREMLYSTQIQNVTAQTALVREGFRLHGAHSTVHVNSLLSRSVVEPCSLDVSLSAGPSAGGAVPGDAGGADPGFCLAFQSYVNRTVGRYYATGFPGADTVLLGGSCKYLKPVRPNRKYALTISFPFVDAEQGAYRSAVKVKDSVGSICLLAYHDLRRRPQD